MAKQAKSTGKREYYHHGNLRMELIQETERMLDANELDQITLNELGKRLGVARSTPYRHFANKNELLCAVATRAFARLCETSRAIRLEKDLTPIERLRKLARNYFYLAVNRRDYYRLMYRADLVGENESEELHVIREENFVELVLLLKECQQAGMINEGDLEA